MKMYVVAHKRADLVLPPDYEYIQVGATKSGNDIYPLKDNSGENISEKNDTFCELTALYWIWKNDTTNDVIGISHYRRFFSTTRWSNDSSKFIDSHDAHDILSSCDMICTNPYSTDGTVRQHFLHKVSTTDMQKLSDAIARTCPDYRPDFISIMEGRETYLLNMMVTRRETFSSYCEWLFPLLFDMEQHVDMTGYSVEQRRLFGFLSEFLLSVHSMRVAIIGSPLWRIAIDKTLRLPQIAYNKIIKKLRS